MDPSAAAVREAEQNVGALDRRPTALRVLSAREGSALLLHAGVIEPTQTVSQASERRRQNQTSTEETGCPRSTKQEIPSSACPPKEEVEREKEVPEGLLFSNTQV